MSAAVFNLLTFTIVLCVFAIVWVHWYAGKVEKAVNKMLQSNAEMRGHLSGILLGNKGIDIHKGP